MSNPWQPQAETMSTKTPLASPGRTGAWDRDLSSLALQFAARLAGPALVEQVVWWGAGFSDLLLRALPALPASHRAVIADSDNRMLRRARAWAGEGGREHRLLALGDLRRDALAVESQLLRQPTADLETYLALQEALAQQFETRPCVADASVDLLVADFLLNRLAPAEWAGALGEAMRVVRRSGRFFCTVLVSDEPITEPTAVRSAPTDRPLHLPDEAATLRAIQAAGFHGITLHWARPDDPTALDRVGDAEVRMLVIECHKGKQGPCFELGQAVVYRGPWRQVHDDDGHVYPRGERVAVCAKTYALLMREPYCGSFIGLRSVLEPDLKRAEPFDCNTPALRDPRVTKGLQPFVGAAAPGSCNADSGCC